MSRCSRFLRVACLALTMLALVRADASAADKVLRPVAEPKQAGPVDFEHDVMPILRKNCVACHSTTVPRGKLVVESPEAILKGGKNGPSVVPNKPDTSLLFVRARGGGKGIMPPASNSAGAKPLTPEELGLLKRWIEQGAKASAASAASKLEWQPLSPGIQPIYAAALTADGQYAACGRANQVFIYQVPSGTTICRLSDPRLQKSGLYQQQEVTDLDIVQSLAFSRDGRWLASGGFRTVKLWQRPANVQTTAIKDLPVAASVIATSIDGKQMALAVGREIRLVDAATGKLLQTITGHGNSVTALRFAADGQTLYSASTDKSLRAWQLPEGKAAGRLDVPDEVLAITLVNKDAQIAAGGKDSVIRVWKLPLPALPVEAESIEPKDESKPAPEAPKPQELKGHGKAVRALDTLASSPTQIISGSEDGLLIHWETSNGQQIRKISHGAAISAVAARPDGQRFASAGGGNSVKLWKSQDGNLVTEVKGEYATTLRLKDQERQLNVAKSRLNAAKELLARVEKVSQQEEESLKKAIEAQATAKKTSEEKTAAAKKALDEQTAAEKAAEAATAAKKKTDDAKAAATQALTDADAALKALGVQPPPGKKDPAKKEKKNKKNKENNDKTPPATADAKPTPEEDEDEKAQQEQAEKERLVREKAVKEAQDKLAAAKQAKNDADKAAGMADQLVKTTTNDLNAKKRPAQVATTERDTAVKALEGADRALAASKIGAQKAAARVKETPITPAEKAVKQAETTLETAKQAALKAELPIKTLAFSADNTQLATAGDGPLVHLWDATTGQPYDTLAGHTGAIQALRFLDARRVVSTSADKRAIVWDTRPTWTWVRTIGGESSADLQDRVTSLDFSPDGKQLVTGGGAPTRNGELKVWNVANGALVRDLQNTHSDTIFGARFSPDGQLIASCGADKLVTIHRASTGELVRSIEGHTHYVLGVAWLPDGLGLASAGADKVVKVWDFASGDQRRTIRDFGKEVTSLVMVGDTNNALTASGDKIVRLQRADNGSNVRTFSGGGGFVYCCDASADGRWVIAGDQDGMLRVWNGLDGQAIRTFEPPAR